MCNENSMFLDGLKAVERLKTHITQRTRYLSAEENTDGWDALAVIKAEFERAESLITELNRKWEDAENRCKKYEHSASGLPTPNIVGG